MSDELLNSFTTTAEGALKSEMGKLSDDYLAGFQSMFDGINQKVLPLVQAHLAKAADYKLAALLAPEEDVRRAYVEGVADELASAKTVLVSEAVAISEEQAATFAAGFDRVLSAVGSVAKSLIVEVGGALVSGAIKGLTGGLVGGGGLDPSSIFPGA